MNQKDLNRTKLIVGDTGKQVLLAHTEANGKVTSLQRFATDEFIDTMVTFLHNMTSGGVKPLILYNNGIAQLQINISVVQGAVPVIGKKSPSQESNIKSF